MTPEGRRTSALTMGDSAVVLATIAVVTLLSVLQGAYHFDPHHWGLIFSNAADLARGRAPYRDVFIQYGILSAALPALFYAIGGTQISIIAGVAAFFGAGISGTYFISLQMSGERRLALYTLLTALLVHPLAIYPWPNYLSYPFIVFGCLLVMKAENRVWPGFAGGVLLGLAVLCREGLFLAVVLSLLLLPVIEAWCSGNRRKVALRLATWPGFALPLGLFALYLASSGLWHDWWQTAVELPRLYAAVFLGEGVTVAGLRLIAYLLPAAPFAQPQQFVLGLVLIAAIFFCILGLVRGSARSIGTATLFVAVFTGLLISSALHINEVFRLASSMLAGTALLYALASRFRCATPVFVFCAGILVYGIFLPGNGNYFLPSPKQVSAGIAGSAPKAFAGQRWSADVYDYYDWYSTSMQAIAARNCGVRYLRNQTRDAYLEALSPFPQHQLMPFGKAVFDIDLDAWERRLRPDYDLAARLRDHDVVIVTSRRLAPGETPAPQDDRVIIPQMAEPSVPENPAPPPGYVEFGHRVAPRSWFMPDGLVTLLWVPESCLPPAGN